jgi:hypothetical protein
MRCQQKFWYLTAAEAAQALRATVAKAKLQGDKAWKRLSVYLCPFCGRYHVGHSRRFGKQMPGVKPAPQKIPSAGALRRKLARIEREWDRQRLHKAAVIGKLIEADRQLIETENEMREIQRQVTAIFLPAATVE